MVEIFDGDAGLNENQAFRALARQEGADLLSKSRPEKKVARDDGAKEDDTTVFKVGHEDMRRHGKMAPAAEKDGNAAPGYYTRKLLQPPLSEEAHPDVHHLQVLADKVNWSKHHPGHGLETHHGMIGGPQPARSPGRDGASLRPKVGLAGRRPVSRPVPRHGRPGGVERGPKIDLSTTFNQPGTYPIPYPAAPSAPSPPPPPLNIHYDQSTAPVPSAKSKLAGGVLTVSKSPMMSKTSQTMISLADEHRKWAEGASEEEFAAMAARVSARANIKRQWLPSLTSSSSRQDHTTTPSSSLSLSSSSIKLQQAQTTSAKCTEQRAQKGVHHQDHKTRRRVGTLSQPHKLAGSAVKPGSDRRLLAKVYTARQAMVHLLAEHDHDSSSEGSPRWLARKARAMNTRRSSVLTHRGGVDYDPALLVRPVEEDGREDDLDRPGPASVEVWEARKEIYREQREQKEQARLQSLVSHNQGSRTERGGWTLAAESLWVEQKKAAAQKKKVKDAVRRSTAAKVRNQINVHDSDMMKLPVLKRNY